MHIAPGSVACLGRAAYYRREAERIDALAADLVGDTGHARFREVAQEYRVLADTLDPDEETAADDAAHAADIGGDGLDSLGHPVAA